MSLNQLVVFGSIVQDLVSYVDRFPNPGESVRGKLFKTYCGGKGANQAVMAAKLGSHVAMIGRVGNDTFGTHNIQTLNSFGIDTSHVLYSDTASTATATINVSADGENCIVVCLAANLELSIKHAREAEEVIAKSRVILCQLEVEQLGNIEAFRLARKHGVMTFFNPAPGILDLNTQILQLTDIICTNENEAEFITGLKPSSIEEFKESAKKMLELGPEHFAIITLGPKGVIVGQNTNGHISANYVKTPTVKAVDTTGAGDCFCGALAHFLANNPDGNIIEMVMKASEIATISVQRPGSQISYPSKEELIALGILERNIKEVHYQNNNSNNNNKH